MVKFETKFRKLPKNQQKVCAIPKIGFEIGFCVSAHKTHKYEAYETLNIKDSISQKKFSLTYSQNFSTFFIKINVLFENPVIPMVWDVSK